MNLFSFELGFNLLTQLVMQNKNIVFIIEKSTKQISNLYQYDNNCLFLVELDLFTQMF